MLTEAVDIYTYVFVRSDLSLAQQVVQTGHACLAAGTVFRPPENTRLVLVGVPDEGELSAVLEFCRERQIGAVSFVEPDPPRSRAGAPAGLTAVCTEPLSEDIRRQLRRFRLWDYDPVNG